MDTALNWGQETANSLLGIWQDFINFIPALIGAIVVFLIGWIIAVAIGKLVAEILKRIQFNKIFETGTWKKALERADIKVDASAFIGAIIKWVLLIVFLVVAIKILGFSQLESFFNDVLSYLPNVVVAAFMFVVAVIIADIVEKVVRATVEGANMGSGPVAGAIIKWSIWILAIFAILLQLGIAEALITTIIQGVVALIVIAGGIAFGLGGKDAAAEVIQDLKNKLK
jgi:Mechanosensitive ion channel, conserved TM helix